MNDHLFRRARIKLTLWYVSVALAISLAFSTVIYGFLVEGIHRFARMQRFRIERRIERRIEPIDNDLETEAIQNLQLIFIALNGGIFVMSAVLCYFVAGQTLKPIQDMMTQQYRFITDASHELKTPLTALRTTFEVALRNSALSLPEAKQVLRENLEEVIQLQSLSEGLLKLSTYQDAFALSFSTSALDEATRRAIKQLTPLAKRKKMQLLAKLETVHVSGIPQQLQELCAILIDNAIKYGQAHTKITVTLTTSQNAAQLAVTNTGVGITPTDLPHIFDRFYRADTSRTKTSNSGYGLGLAIAKQIVALHHGKIEAHSTVGKSTTFTVTLPTAG